MEQEKKSEPKQEPTQVPEKKKPGRKRKISQMMRIVRELVVLHFD